VEFRRGQNPYQHLRNALNRRQEEKRRRNRRRVRKWN
jgi:hypothetical protein